LEAFSNSRGKGKGSPGTIQEENGGGGGGGKVNNPKKKQQPTKVVWDGNGNFENEKKVTTGGGPKGNSRVKE